MPGWLLRVPIAAHPAVPHDRLNTFDFWNGTYSMTSERVDYHLREERGVRTLLVACCILGLRALLFAAACAFSLCCGVTRLFHRDAGIADGANTQSVGL